MRITSADIYHACFAGGFMAAIDAKRAAVTRPGEMSGFDTDGGTTSTVVTEWIAGDPLETVARKVITGRASAYWVRADLVMRALEWLATAEAERVRITNEVTEWSIRQDQANAAKRGMSVEEYRKERNAQMQRAVQRSGINSVGIR